MAKTVTENNKVRRVFVNNLKTLLSINGWTVADLARKLSMRDSTVRDWATSRTFPSSKNMELLAKAFGVPASILLAEGTSGEGLSASQMELIKKASAFTEAEAEVALRVLSAIRNE